MTEELMAELEAQLDAWERDPALRARFGFDLFAYLEVAAAPQIH